MESQKMAYRTELSAYSATVADSDGRHREYISHEKVRETISKIEALKEAHAGIPSFLPAWADDKYFQSMHKERKADKCLFIRQYKTAGRTMDEVESEISDKKRVHVQDIDIEKVKTFVHGIIEKAACRALHGEVQEKVHVQDIDNEKVKTFVCGIIGKACKELHREEVFQQFQITIGGKVRMASNICREDKSVAYRTIHKLAMKPVLAELTQHTQGKARSFRDSVLNPSTEKDFVARALSLTQSFGAVCDQVSCVRPKPKSAQCELPQYTFLHTAGIPTGRSSCVDNKQRQRSSWKKRILTCFGL